MTSHLNLYLIGLLFVLSRADQAAEISANTVEVKLYPLSKSEFIDNKDSDFQSVLSTYANQYCSGNPSNCGGNSNPGISDTNVAILNVKDDSKSMFADVYIDLPGAASSPFVLSADSLEVILQNARDGVHDRTGSWITYIGESYFGVPIQSTANAVIIPIACLTVAVVGVVTLLLTKWEEKQERKSRRQLRANSKKQNSETPDKSFSVQHDSGVMFRPDRPRTAHHGNGNKVVPNGGSASYSQESAVVTTRPLSKFRERTEMTSVTRNEFTLSEQEESRAQVKVHKEVTGHSDQTGSRAVTHTEVVNGQLVDHLMTPPTYTSPDQRVVSEEETERKRRKREKRERRAERERDREMRKKLAQKDE